MEKKQLRNVFTIALLLSTPLFASQDAVSLTRVQAAKAVAEQNLQVAKAKMQAGLAVAKQFGIDKKDVFVAASKAQAATFMQSPKANSAAIAAGLYAGYDAMNMVPAVNPTDSRTVKGAKVVGKVAAGSVAFTSQFAAVQFLVSNWNVLLNPMQDKVKTAKVVAVALVNLAYYTPQVRALVVKAASYVGLNAFALGSTVVAKMPAMLTLKRSAVTENIPVVAQNAGIVSSIASKVSAAASTVTGGKVGTSTAKQRQAQFIADAINVLHESSNSVLKNMFKASLDKVVTTNIYFRQQGANVILKESILSNVFATEVDLGIFYAGTSARVLDLVNKLLKLYTVKRLNLTKGNPDYIKYMNSEIDTIIAELQS